MPGIAGHTGPAHVYHQRKAPAPLPMPVIPARSCTLGRNEELALVPMHVCRQVWISTSVT